ncbi:universal stress protein (plasmid) [Skermanella rosea]|uniref:universal stress protein n=1 Tax=Skermanella rosea TaxID=1817965 RepID=UPI001934B3E3|nr:universal stress protein [Skermanella rosea]UEM07708.1 universal stress protein [Skermanella rosea]
MPLRKITVHLTGDTSDQMALQSAFQIAARFRCRVDALFVWPDEFEEPYAADGPGLLSDVFISAGQDDAEPRYRLTRRYFHAACAESGFREAEAHMPDGDPTARLRKVVGPPESVAIEARASDLVVFAHHGPSADAGAVEARRAAISIAGRPVLLCPPVLREGMGDVILVAWNSTEHATRAIAGALPFLCAAREVHVLTVSAHHPGSGPDHVRCGLMVEYLRLHGIKARDAEVVQAGSSVAATLLAAAERVRADLLVMGCSGKGRLSEFVLGNVSRDVIAQATLPLLVAH